MQNFRLAVKAFIVKHNQLLLLKRRSNDVHSPNEWDIPGGRLNPAEDPFVGLKREVQEETGLDIQIKMPLDVHHFTRDDGQVITMLIFLCEPVTNEVKISEEHQEFTWKSLAEPKENFPSWLKPVLKNYLEIKK